MEWLQTIAENSGMPVLTAFALGLLTALSPCPLATNIAAVGFISRDTGSRRRIFRNGLLYTLGRTVAYTALGLVLIGLLKEGAAIFRVQKYIARYGEMIIGPVLLVMALFMLAGHRLPLPSFGFSGRGEDLAQRGGWGAFLLGVLFALAFCPSSGILYFGMLIPLSATSAAGWLLPAVFAVATALPVLVIAWILAFSAQRIGTVYGRMQTVRKWLNTGVGILFTAVGTYYCITLFL